MFIWNNFGTVSKNCNVLPKYQQREKKTQIFTRATKKNPTFTALPSLPRNAHASLEPQWRLPAAMPRRLPPPRPAWPTCSFAKAPASLRVPNGTRHSGPVLLIPLLQSLGKGTIFPPKKNRFLYAAAAAAAAAMRQRERRAVRTGTGRRRRPGRRGSPGGGSVSSAR